MIVMTACFAKWTKAILNTKTNAAVVACVFFALCIVNYGNRYRLITGNGPQFVSKFFAAVYSRLGANKITTTEYDLQINGQRTISPLPSYRDCATPYPSSDRARIHTYYR